MNKTTKLLTAGTTIVAALVATASIATANDGNKTLTPDAKARLLSAQTTKSGADVEPGTQGVERIAGMDRYETAAKMSQTLWSEDNTGAVFLAVGTKFPDAVAASASTALLGPVLFTETDYLPEATRAELARLRPCLVFVIGAPSSVSPSVAIEADAYTNPERCFS